MFVHLSTRYPQKDTLKKLSTYILLNEVSVKNSKQRRCTDSSIINGMKFKNRIEKQTNKKHTNKNGVSVVLKVEVRIITHLNTTPRKSQL